MEEGARLGLGRPVRRWSSNPGERGWSPDLRWWLRDWEKKNGIIQVDSLLRRSGRTRKDPNE